MDRNDLESKLENFKKACIEMDYVDADKEILDIEESFPGMIPTSYIVNVHVKNHWLDQAIHRQAYKALTDLLYEKTEMDALIKILALRMCSNDGLRNFESSPTEIA